jgi:hypothetical protein
MDLLVELIFKICVDSKNFDNQYICHDSLVNCAIDSQGNWSKEQLTKCIEIEK